MRISVIASCSQSRPGVRRRNSPGTSVPAYASCASSARTMEYPFVAIGDHCTERQSGEPAGDAEPSLSCVSGRLVAEHRRVAPGPLPHRSRAHDARVGELRLVLETARVQADRAEPQLPAGFGELLEQAFERRAAVAGLTVHRSRQTEPYGVLGRPDNDLFALLLRRRRDE